MAKAAADKPKPMSKSEVVSSLAESTGLGKKEVVSVLDGLEGLIGTSLGKKGPGVFALPGLIKIQVQTKKATPAKPGINPRTGEAITIKITLITFSAESSINIVVAKGLQCSGSGSSGKYTPDPMLSLSSNLFNDVNF